MIVRSSFHFGKSIGIGDETRLSLPLSDEDIRDIRPGNMLYLSGIVYTARDQAHKRICQTLSEGREPPFRLEGAAIYYCGPTPLDPSSPFAFGSAGPTTSLRMDFWTFPLLERGVKVFIGKGQRSARTAQDIKRHGAVYFSTIGGAGALLSSCVRAAELIAYPDLGCEAVYRLDVVDFPVFVG